MGKMSLAGVIVEDGNSGTVVVEDLKELEEAIVQEMKEDQAIALAEPHSEGGEKRDDEGDGVV